VGCCLHSLIGITAAGVAAGVALLQSATPPQSYFACLMSHAALLPTALPSVHTNATMCLMLQHRWLCHESCPGIWCCQSLRCVAADCRGGPSVPSLPLTRLTLWRQQQLHLHSQQRLQHVVSPQPTIRKYPRMPAAPVLPWHMAAAAGSSACAGGTRRTTPQQQPCWRLVTIRGHISSRRHCSKACAADPSKGSWPVGWC
jgi:hypothetical protein